MSAHVVRVGARQITVRDEAGRELAFSSEHHALHINTMGAGPWLTPRWLTTSPTNSTSGQAVSKRCGSPSAECTDDDALVAARSGLI